MRSWCGLIISLLLYDRFIFSEGSFLSDKILAEEDDNILSKFFAQFKSIIDHPDLKHITVIGGSGDQLQQVKPLLEAFPHFIGDDVKKLCASKAFAPNTVFVYFLASLEEAYLSKVVEDLHKCEKDSVTFVLDDVMTNDVDIDLIYKVILKKFTRKHLIIFRQKKSLKLYGVGIGNDCSKKHHLISEWKPGNDLKRLGEWHATISFKGCPIPIGTIDGLPWAKPKSRNEKDNGTLRIAGGIEGRIIETIAEELEFTPAVQNFKFSDANESNGLSAIVSSCAVGNTTICIGKIHPTKQVMHAVDVTIAYAHDCMVWCVPRIPRWKMNVMTSEFSWSTWILIGLTFLASIALDKIVRNTRHLNGGGGGESRNHSLFLDFVGLTIGDPIVYKPLALGGKMLLVFYLCYSTVMTTAYKTSLSSLLTTGSIESSIVDIEGIIKANLTTGGTADKLGILENQIEEFPSIPELIKRFLIEPNISKALRRVSQDKDLAYLVQKTDLYYYQNLFARSGEPLSIDVIDECVVPIASTIVLPKSSHVTNKINHILKQLSESGLLDYWMKVEGVPRQGDPLPKIFSEDADSQKQLPELSREKFLHMFFIYCLALIFCTLVFLGELLVHKFRLAERVGRFKNPQRIRTRRRVHFQPTQRHFVRTYRSPRCFEYRD